MKTLVVYYSRTGVTRTVAEALAEELAADVEELIDPKNRAGATGWLGGGKDAVLKRLTDLPPARYDPAGYDLVVIGTPVWALTMAPAVRTYLTRHRQHLPRLAAFCTLGGKGDKKTFRDIAELTGKELFATLSLIDRDVKAGRHVEPVKEFASRLRPS